MQIHATFLRTVLSSYKKNGNRCQKSRWYLPVRWSSLLQWCKHSWIHNCEASVLPSAFPVTSCQQRSGYQQVGRAGSTVILVVFYSYSLISATCSDMPTGNVSDLKLFASLHIPCLALSALSLRLSWDLQGQGIAVASLWSSLSQQWGLSRGQVVYSRSPEPWNVSPFSSSFCRWTAFVSCLWTEALIVVWLADIIPRWHDTRCHAKGNIRGIWENRKVPWWT